MPTHRAPTKSKTHTKTSNILLTISLVINIILIINAIIVGRIIYFQRLTDDFNSHLQFEHYAKFLNLRNDLQWRGIIPGAEQTESCRDIPEEDCPVINPEDLLEIPPLLDVANILHRLEYLELQN